LWLHSLKVAQLLRSAACLHTNQSRSYLNHLVITYSQQLSTWLFPGPEESSPWPQFPFLLDIWVKPPCVLLHLMLPPTKPCTHLPLFHTCHILHLSLLDLIILTFNGKKQNIYQNMSKIYNNTLNWSSNTGIFNAWPAELFAVACRPFWKTNYKRD